MQKRTLLQFADSIGPDQHAHLCSLIWAYTLIYTTDPVILLADRNVQADQACIVCKLYKGPFCTLCIIYDSLSSQWMCMFPKMIHCSR